MALGYASANPNEEEGVVKLGRLFGMSIVMVVLGATVALAQLGPGGSFGDDDGSVHEADIEAIAAEGITRGCNPPQNDRFCPDDPVTRGQMAAFLVRALDLPGSSDDRFEDDDGSVFEAEIQALAAAGVTRGCNPPQNDRFCPDSFVTRGQMAAFLVRALGYDDPGTRDYFTDDANSVFQGDIQRLRTADVTRGCNPPQNDLFCPDDLVTRGQMASFLTRALGLTPIQPPPPTSSTSTTSTTTPTSNTCANVGGSVGGDLIVESGTTCTLDGTRVEGNIEVRSNATLRASGVIVDGNVQAERHASVQVDQNAFVDGDIQAEDGGAVTVADATVGGNIQLEDNAGKILVRNNDVDGDIQVDDNTGGVEIRDNTVQGNLQCEGNSDPVAGGNNTVFGDKEGQCSGF